MSAARRGGCASRGRSRRAAEPGGRVRRAPRSLGRLAVALLALSGLGCAAERVTRVVDGRLVVGPYVVPAAYDGYLRGVLAEADGDWTAASTAFARALDEDPNSPELWARAAAVSCQLGQFDAADRRFAQALELDESYEPAWWLRAQCLRKRGLHDQALGCARTAAALDPDRLEGQLLVGELLLHRGQGAEALRWHRGIVARWPSSVHAWRALAHAAASVGDRGWQLLAAARLGERRGGRGAALVDALAASPLDGPAAQTFRSAAARRTIDLWGPIDVALRAGRLAEARALARATRVDGRLLAPRAIVVGRPDLGREQAALLLAADPDDTDSRLALALALDLDGAGAELDELLGLPRRAAPLSALSRELLGELVVRRAGALPGVPELVAVLAGEPVAPSAAGVDEATSDLLGRLRRRWLASGAAASAASGPAPAHDVPAPNVPPPHEPHEPATVRATVR